MATALLVIDVQQGMFSFESSPYDADAVIGRIQRLIEDARSADVPIFFVQHAGPPGDPLAPEGPGFAFVAEVAPRPDDDVTTKTECNAFRATGLERKLRAADVDHVVICGMQTEFCVDTAVRAASDRGFRVTLVSDAHTTLDSPALAARDIVAHHNSTLGTFAEMVPAASALGASG